jgi:predicted Fe-Mo cluster-binding NifX family protein
MRTIISSTGNRLESRFDLRFGRAGWFCLYDEETEDISFVENEFRDEIQGAGRKVVEKMVGLGAGKVISGDFGPKAKDLLNRFNIQMVILPDEGQTIAQIISKLKKE